MKERTGKHIRTGTVSFKRSDNVRRLPERFPLAWSLVLLAVDLLAVLSSAYAAGVPADAAPATGLTTCLAFAACGMYQRSYAIHWRDEAYHVLTGCIFALVPLWLLLHVVAKLPSTLPILTLVLTWIVVSFLHCLLHYVRTDGTAAYAKAEYVSPQAQWRSKSTWFRVWKTAFDVLLGAAALVVASPVMLVAAACILIETGSPVFFRQERIGRSGSRFFIYKFRTMVKGADSEWARPGDARITRVGAFLRRASIDELPQLFNVLRGEMSLVGPRPEMESFAREFGQTISHYDQRHVIEPGITGWAQIHLRRNLRPADIPSVLPYDLFYAEHASPVLDAIIIAKTAVELIFHRAV